MISHHKISVLRALGLVLLSCSLFTVRGAGDRAAWAQATGNATPPAPAGTPATSAAPTPDAAAKAACAKMARALESGDISAWQALPPEKRSALEATNGVQEAFTCLAVAQNQSRYCDALKDGKDACVELQHAVQDLKALPKGASMETLISSRLGALCTEKFPKPTCNQLQEALQSGQAGKCDALPPELSGFCAALVTGDAKHCPPAEDGCSRGVEIISKLKKMGLGGLKSGDPEVLLAARQGKTACAPLLVKLEQRCSQ